MNPFDWTAWCLFDSGYTESFSLNFNLFRFGRSFEPFNFVCDVSIYFLFVIFDAVIDELSVYIVEHIDLKLIFKPKFNKTDEIELCT